MKMKFPRTLAALPGLEVLAGAAKGQTNLDSVMPIGGFCISAPRPKDLDGFIAFIGGALVPRHVNTLVLMVNYNYRHRMTMDEIMKAGAVKGR